MTELPFDQERREIYTIRGEICRQINILRGRYGNKDGHAPDGSFRRYEDKMWVNIEAMLTTASGYLFEAEKVILNLPSVEKTIP